MTPLIPIILLGNIYSPNTRALPYSLQASMQNPVSMIQFHCVSRSVVLPAGANIKPSNKRNSLIKRNNVSKLAHKQFYFMYRPGVYRIIHTKENTVEKKRHKGLNNLQSPQG